MKPKDYPRSVLEEKVRGLDVKIIGVEHSPDFLSEHRVFLEDRIKESDAIMLEGGREFWKGYSKFDDFFKELGNIAGSQQKRVYQADSRTAQAMIRDFAQTAIGMGMVLATFFTNFYIGLSGLYLASGSLAGIILRYLPKGIYAVKKGMNPDNINLSNSYETLFYGGTDHANVMIAEGIDKISSEVKDVKRLACFHGDAHSKPIQVYLRYPAFRKFKRLLYLPTYDYVSNKKVREYTPINEGWELSKKF